MFEILSTVVGPDLDGLERREAGLDQELDLPQATEPRNHTTDTGRIRAGHEKASGRDEGSLEGHFYL